MARNVEMVAETNLYGSDNFVGDIFWNENSRLAKVYDFISGYSKIRCLEMEIKGVRKTKNRPLFYCICILLSSLSGSIAAIITIILAGAIR